MPEHPKMDKSPPELVARFDELAALVAGDSERKPMFGYPSCQARGYMFMSLFRDHLVLRLGGDDLAAFTERYGDHPFEPMAGRRMTGFVLVPSELTGSDDVEDWVHRARAGVDLMPAKKPKPAKKSATTSPAAKKA
jgi:hypothetical protein